MNQSNLRVKRQSKPWLYVSAVVVLVLALVALADYPAVGQLCIGLYAPFAFWRLGSAPVFKLALVALGVVLAATMLNNIQLADSFAGYVFLLFLVGVFVLVRELWYFSKALRREKEETA